MKQVENVDVPFPLGNILIEYILWNLPTFQRRKHFVIDTINAFDRDILCRDGMAKPRNNNVWNKIKGNVP